MYVNYPNKNYCCQLCPIGQCCTCIKPTWIQNGQYDGIQIINNRTCNVWNGTGAVAMDYWSQDNNDIPCAYYEVVTDP